MILALKPTILVLGIFFSVSSYAQQMNEIKNWRYIPQNEEFWGQLLEKMGTPKEKANLFNFVTESSLQASLSDLAGAEKYLALADVMVMEGNAAGASVLYQKVLRQHPGTFQSQKSLVELAKLAEKIDLDEIDLENVLNLGAYSEAPSEALPMIFYYQAMNSSKKKLNKWTKDNISKIPVSSYWHLKRKYIAAASVAEKNQELSLKLFTQIKEEAKDYPSLLWKTNWQLARLQFNRKEYQAAEAIYSTIEVPQRVRGAMQLERSWTKYYLQDYAGALGLLEALKSPSFRVAPNPEQYLLAILIYRDVCHYPKVSDLLKEFKSQYEKSWEEIKVGKDLLSIKQMQWMGLQSSPARDLANFVDQLIKDQKTILQKLDGESKSTFAKNITKWLKTAEESIKHKVNYEIKNNLYTKANNFLSIWDQINLAEYISKLDEYRIKQIFEKREYKAETAQDADYNQLFWPVNGEYWADEFPNYRIILNDRCAGPSSKGKGQK